MTNKMLKMPFIESNKVLTSTLRLLFLVRNLKGRKIRNNLIIFLLKLL